MPWLIYLGAGAGLALFGYQSGSAVGKGIEKAALYGGGAILAVYALRAAKVLK